MCACKGKKTIITGATSGYGYGDAKILAAEGADVWIVGRRLERLQAISKELGVKYVQADISNSEGWDKIFDATQGVDILINNAGSGIKVEPLAKYSDEEIFQSINTNLTGAILGCRRAAIIMEKQKSGTIINISSVCAHYGWPGFACYSAAKAGLDMFSRTLYTELRPYNIRVTLITPSWGATEFNKSAHLPDTDPEIVKKSMSPEQMGELVKFICNYPENMVFPEVMVQPLVQEIIPF